MDLETLKTKVFVSCPYSLLVTTYLDRIRTERLQPEISLNDGSLDSYTLRSFAETARILAEEGLSCTFHAPFLDLSLGAIDPKVRRVTQDRLEYTLEIARIFGARSVVCHTGFDHRHYGPYTKAWIKNAVLTLLPLTDQASSADIPIMLENVFELDPSIHAEIFTHIPSPHLGFCLDLGHQTVFSRSDLATWMNACGRRLGHVHLHDNRGEWDEHLTMGSGILDFDALFSRLKEDGLYPILTIEAHRSEDILPSLAALSSLLDRYPIGP
ncbi:MAG: sugar phosphate isomerase/epimerase [Deltaproteobacteria bacterium]